MTEHAPSLSSPAPERPELGYKDLLSGYDERSRVLQMAAGVDVTRCLRLVADVTPDETASPDYLGALSQRRYLVPSPGPAQGHDWYHHFRRVRQLHPDSVDIVAAYAALGVKAVEDQVSDVVSRNTEVLNLFLEGVYSQHAYPALMLQMLRQLGYPDVDSRTARLCQQQELHQQRMFALDDKL